MSHARMKTETAVFRFLIMSPDPYFNSFLVSNSVTILNNLMILTKRMEQVSAAV